MGAKHFGHRTRVIAQANIKSLALPSLSLAPSTTTPPPRHHHAEPWAGIAIVANLGWSCPRPAAIHEINRRARALAAASAFVRTAFGQPVHRLALRKRVCLPWSRINEPLLFAQSRTLIRCCRSCWLSLSILLLVSRVWCRKTCIACFPSSQ